MRIYILAEVDSVGMIHILARKTLQDLIKSFPFSSNKSLDEFLKKHAEAIINNLGDTDEACMLERQNFLEYKNIKWYRMCEEQNDVPRLSSERILELALECKAVTEQHLKNYLLKDADDCSYQLQEQEL